MLIVISRFVVVTLLALILVSCGGGGGTTAPDSGSGTVETGATGEPYDMGSPTLTDYYLSPTGNDSSSGTSVSAPLRTLDAAWALIPSGTLSGTGYRFNLMPGSYPCGSDEMASCTNYFAGRTGTSAFPIIIRSVDAAGAESNGTAIVRGGMDINGVSYLYLIGLSMPAGNPYPINNSGNDVLHIASSDHILMRSLTLTGSDGRVAPTYLIQEVIKVNQGSAIYLESSDVSGTFQTVVDYFAVRTGHFINNRIHDSGGRCAYLKGGSAYFRIEGNEFYDCVEAGFQAGEGSNLNLMESPWIHYEAYDIKVVNNVIRDIYGAGLSVSGGYNILMAYNTLYRVGMTDAGAREWTLAQFVHGSRGCIIVDEYPSAALASARCQTYIDAGGFGSATAIASGLDSAQIIPNRNVFVYNNIFYNPAGVSTASATFAVDGPETPAADVRNVANPSATDDGLTMRGNIIWNGSGLALFGSTNGSTPGCADGHPTCNSAQMAADNAINTIEPQLTDPVGGDFTPVAGSNVITAASYAIPAFTWLSFSPVVATGNLSNEITENRAGTARSGADHPGAY